MVKVDLKKPKGIILEIGPANTGGAGRRMSRAINA